MNDFITQFNKETENKYDYIRVHSVNVSVKETMIEIILLIPQHIYDLKLTQEDKAFILKQAAKIIPYPFKVRVEYKKSYPDITFILRDVLDYVNKKFPALNTVIKENSLNISVEEDVIKIHITLEKSAYSYLKHSGAEDRLKKYMSYRYCNSLEISYTTLEDSSLEDDNRDFASETKNSQFVEVNNLNCLIGKQISSRPNYIKDVKTESSKIAVCGRIKGLYKNIARESEKIYYIFTLDDTTGTIKALYFPKLWSPKTQEPKAIAKAKAEYENKLVTLDKLVNDSSMGDYTVIIEGNTKQDMNGEITMFINHISACDIDFSSIKTGIVKKKVPDSYTIVEPRPFIDTFKRANAVVPNYLKNKRIVVFDFETTGVDPVRDTPIEIGAVSIVNGSIEEEFFTYINPGRKIPEEITRLTHISDIDVADAPSIKDIIPDFYKFCHKAILVAHNTEFDYAFLKNAANEDGYIFDNERQDTLAMSRKLVKGLDKYSLDNLCKYFDIVNEGAHRAIYDAIATARLYLLLIDRL